MAGDVAFIHFPIFSVRSPQGAGVALYTVRSTIAVVELFYIVSTLAVDFIVTGIQKCEH
jgi:hypothetical protein